MTHQLEAIFENGVFRPVNRLDVAIPEGQHVKLSFETNDGHADPLALAKEVYKGLSNEELEVIERIALTRGKFFDGKHRLA